MSEPSSSKQKKAPLKKILFFAEGATLSHILRPMELASGLDQTQFEIFFACDEKFHHIVGGRGFNLIKISSQSSEEFVKNLDKGQPVFSVSTLKAYIEDDLKVIDSVGPDLVVGDLRLSLSASTELRGVTYINITNSYWSPNYVGAYKLPDIPLSRMLPNAVANILFQIARPIAFATHTFPLNKARKSYGLKSLGLNLNNLYTKADYTVYCNLKDDYKVSGSCENHIFLGPVLCSLDGELPSWWHSLPSDKPIIGLSIGSSGNVKAYNALLSALDAMDATVVVVTAGRADIEDVAGRRFVTKYPPADALAERSDLVICNGGSTAIQMAFSKGTPVLGIPANLDQYLSCESLLNNGGGLVVRSDSLNKEVLVQCMTQILEEPSFKVAAKNQQEIYQSNNAIKAFEQVVSNAIT
jgi:UDP:flavonoid glycosyltransferase YjiC (YdhE family)